MRRSDSLRAAAAAAGIARTTAGEGGAPTSNCPPSIPTSRTALGRVPSARESATASASPKPWVEPDDVGGGGAFEQIVHVDRPGRAAADGGVDQHDALGASPGVDQRDDIARALADVERAWRRGSPIASSPRSG